MLPLLGTEGLRLQFVGASTFFATASPQDTSRIDQSSSPLALRHLRPSIQSRNTTSRNLQTVRSILGTWERVDHRMEYQGRSRGAMLLLVSLLVVSYQRKYCTTFTSSLVRLSTQFSLLCFRRTLLPALLTSIDIISCQPHQHPMIRCHLKHFSQDDQQPILLSQSTSSLKSLVVGTSQTHHINIIIILLQRLDRRLPIIPHPRQHLQYRIIMFRS